MLTIGICGASGSGKTTLADALADRLGERCVYIKQDSYYTDHSELSFEARCKLNYDAPDAFDYDSLVADFKSLGEGRPITRKGYDYTVHARSDSGELIQPADVAVFEGIHAFGNAEVRRLLDLKVFIQVDSDICLLRRVKRDMRERGRDILSIEEQYRTYVKPMYDQFIRNYAQFADIILANGGDNPMFVDMLMLYIDSKSQKNSAPREPVQKFL